jgi:hypothetical protein
MRSTLCAGSYTLRAIFAFQARLGRIGTLEGWILGPPGPPLLPLFTEIRGETVWKIAEGVSRALLRGQEWADRDSFDTSWPLSGPPFRTRSEFPNSFGRRILRSSHTKYYIGPVLKTTNSLELLTSTGGLPQDVGGADIRF